ncbi:TolC family protein [Sphingomonas cavernae]|uniref:TolC family protein n=1 Tax=Sphingomonas cavernae TaxID=2320861 RepID=A0A418WN12_9SPHN|nr:TolC family protein [Sphingomonas cavernae]RJF91391.1 TolC family protein [Sphingomonas cavernae]
MANRSLLAWLLTGCAIIATTPGVAQVAPAFPELLRRAASSPRLSAGEADVDAARGEARQARTRPNPVLNTEVENFAGGRPYDRFDQAETTVSVQQPLELGGKRSARAAVADADVRTADARAEQARVDLARDLATAYASAEAMAARVIVARDALDLAGQDARVARLLVENGREARVRSVQAEAAVAAARGDLASAEAESDAALARLGALLGTPNAFTSIAGGLLDAPLPALTGDGESPAVRVARAERDAARWRIDSERRRAIPDITVSLGARRLEADDATAMVAGVSVPLPLFDRNRGSVDSASAAARAAEARLAEAAAVAEADRLAARTRVRAAEARVLAAIEGETAAAEAHRLARIGYEGGKMPLIELLGARRALVEARSRTIEVRLARIEAAAELARSQGASLAGAKW